MFTVKIYEESGMRRVFSVDNYNVTEFYPEDGSPAVAFLTFWLAACGGDPETHRVEGSAVIYIENQTGKTIDVVRAPITPEPQAA